MANGQNVQPESGLDERPSMRDDSLDDVSGVSPRSKTLDSVSL